MTNIIDKVFTWSAEKITPKWCQTPEHWTSKVTAYLWTDCPCCLLFRGIVVGMMIASCVWAPLTLLF